MQDYNMYARRTSNGPVPGVLYLQYGTSSQVPESYAYQSLFIVPEANLQLVGQLGKNCCAGRNKPCCAGRSKACGTSLEPSGQLTVKSIRMLFMRFVYLAVTTSLSFETSFYFIQCLMLGHKSRSTTMLIVCQKLTKGIMSIVCRLTVESQPAVVCITLMYVLRWKYRII